MTRARFNWTIVIGSTRQVAESVMRYHAFREIPAGDYAPWRMGQGSIVVGGGKMRFEALSAAIAPTSLEGARPDRIVIADYLRWGIGNQPGTTAHIWHQIQRIQAMSKTPVKVTFLP